MTSPHPTPNLNNLSQPSSFSFLFDRCLSFSSISSAHSIHAHLLKLGLYRHTFLGNRLLHLYSSLGALTSVIRAFNNIPTKNIFTWNILLSAFSSTGRMTDACKVFDTMPDRDAVSWNSIISGYARIGLFDAAFTALRTMRELGFKANSHTVSISASCIFSPLQAKQIHGTAIRSFFDSTSAVIGNSLIKMYTRTSLVNYAYSVFQRLEKKDTISWNSMISAFGNSGHGFLAFVCFKRMCDSGFSPDEFSISAMISLCANLEDKANGELLLGRSIKIGFVTNSIVSSAVIDMYSQCGRLGDSLRFFEEREKWDSAILNSILSAYTRHRHPHEALNIFRMALTQEVWPTEFTFATILSSSLRFGVAELGMQIHCWVHKLGMEVDAVVSTALVDMYMKLGSVESATKVFTAMALKDLISWNTMIWGLAQNGQVEEAFRKFDELVESQIKPDRITLLGVLSACNHGRMVEKGKRILSSMEEEHGIECGIEHYACVVEMMGRVGRLEEAVRLIETMPHNPSGFILGLVLEACILHKKLSLAEMVAVAMITMPESHVALPYFVLAGLYGRRGMWESVAWIWKMMEERGVKRVSGCSWIGIKNQVFCFDEDDVVHHGGEAMYFVLGLLNWDMAKEGSDQRAKLEQNNAPHHLGLSLMNRSQCKSRTSFLPPFRAKYHFFRLSLQSRSKKRGQK